MEIILASKSPRRRELLQLVGLDFSVVPSNADESAILEDDPAMLVRRLASVKCEAVKSARSDCLVIGADTIVVYDGQVIGKPTDAHDAKRILRLLSGKTHTVYSGLCVMTDEKKLVCHDTTYVTFADLSDEVIDAYVATGDPLDKAGAYGIQGMFGMFVERIDGNYFNVIGMPLPRLYELMLSAGVDIMTLNRLS